MLKLICIFGLLHACSAAVAVATPLDKACTGPDGMYTGEAIVCEDKEAYCKDEYKTPVKNGTNTERPDLCFSADKGNTLNADIKKEAVQSCPKSCGYCCLSPDWNCKNHPPGSPGLTCDTILPEKCNSPAWKDQIARDCPNKCGFCLVGGCVDNYPSVCSDQPDICTNFMNIGWVMENCKRTCNNCDGSKTPTIKAVVPQTTENPNCKDRLARCPEWAAGGYCENKNYSPQIKLQDCPKSCKLC